VDAADQEPVHVESLHSTPSSSNFEEGARHPPPPLPQATDSDLSISEQYIVADRDDGQGPRVEYRRPRQPRRRPPPPSYSPSPPPPSDL
jgi:hypothetical protein